MKRVKLLKSGLNSLKLPVMWVLFCAVVSGIAYAAGVGRPTVESISGGEAGKPWFRQEAPQLLIAEGSRQRRRAVALYSLGRMEQSKKWNGWARESFARAAELWKDTPVECCIVVAEARARADGGDYRGAAAMLETLSPAENDPAFLARLYDLGTYWEKLGEKEKARQYFDHAYAGADRVSRKSFDNMLERVLNDRGEAARILKVSMACDAAMSPQTVKDLLKDYDLPAAKQDREAENIRKKWTEQEEQARRQREKEEAKAPEYQVEKVK